MTDTPASDKAARLTIRRSAIVVFKTMQAGESMRFDLPRLQPAKRDMYLVLLGAASSAFGNHHYAVKSKDGVMVITRLVVIVCTCSPFDYSGCIAPTVACNACGRAVRP